MANGTPSRDEVIAKIQKVLALANDPNTTEGERETASNMAAALMAKYQIAAVDVKSDGGKGGMANMTEIAIDGFSPMFQQWTNMEGMLINGVARSFDCRCIMSLVSYYSSGAPMYAFKILGHKSDVALAEHFSKFARTYIYRTAEVRYKNKRKKDMKSFVYGAVSVVILRLEKLNRKVQDMVEAEGCTALILRKKDQVADFVKERYPHLRRGGGVSTSNMSYKDYNQGRDFGKQMPLHRPINGRTHPAGHLE